MVVDRSDVRGGTSVRCRSRRVGLIALTTAFSASLGINAALATCGSPSTQLTAGRTESAVVTFGTVNNSQPASAGGLSINCSTGTNGSTVAGYYANLPNGGSHAAVGSCTFTGSLNGWTTGAANGTSVTFTSTSPNTNVTDIAVSGGATAVTTQGGAGTLATGLGGKTVCVGTAGNWTNQEFHAGTTGGSITDWKQGAGNATDPTATIGSWSISGNTVVYTYSAGGTYTYTVWDNGNNNYDFCNGTSPVVSGAVIKSGQVAC